MVNKTCFGCSLTKKSVLRNLRSTHIALFLGLFSQMACSGNVILEKGTGYSVPENVVWQIDQAPIANCKVCTADIYIKGEMSQVEIEGVIVNGEFTLSINNDDHAKILLYPGTEIWLGDTRHKLIINTAPLE